ncbi:aldehyde dehydrogenase (NADP(+)) [Luteolibacter pohnpeiensis]|uniref:Aldehyde dehydrogenase (NADP(+)) n=1 Tax=Luteolibacter pohnpeiensis TaxID=454153 RepID=A0A934S258_9BACT|nr:aldehyde dehydrogenase (NADP(+)) [Luteolibacter pohnpeiensis]MBK1881021.1 aldehyde dehydrogenase (NADP(+)) [Luteolibacter pohnpeiensis]
MSLDLLGTSFIGYSRGTGHNSCGKAINPATSEELEPTFRSATPDEVEKAMALAKSAFPIYSKLPGSVRAKFLRTIAEKIGARVELLAKRAPLETALPEARIRGEAARTMGQFQLFADLIEEGSWVDARIERAIPDRQPLAKPDLRSMQVPLGPVAVFCASNFPLAYSVAGVDTSSALAAGCPVVAIVHESHMGTAELVAGAVIEAARECEMPEGVFSSLCGGGRTVGVAVVKHPITSAVGFTGSRSGGTALMEIAASRPCPIPVYAEMSAINPLVILPSAIATEPQATALAEAYFASLTLGCGQFCTNPGLVFLPDTGAEPFVEKLRSLIAAAPAAVMLNEGIARAYQTSTNTVADQPEIDLLAKSEARGLNTAPPVVFTTTAAKFLENPKLQAEMFGPASILVFGSSSEIETALAKLEGQLTASIFGSGDEISWNTGIVDQLRKKSGRFIFNGFPTGVEVCSSMVHGGPFPATSDGRSSSVGTMAIFRFCRPAAWQNAPQDALPPELRDENPLGISQHIH